MDKRHILGFEHLGIPSSNIERTISFYEKLGFSVVMRTNDPNTKAEVAFLSLGNFVIETYEKEKTAGKNGALDHFSLLIDDVEALYKEALADGFEILTNGIETLPFWENGVSFFKSKGPDGESVELLERL